MQLDRKFLLIAPTIVLALVGGGLIYAAMQLQILGDISDTLQERSAFVASVERGEKVLQPRQSIALLKIAMDVEAKRTAAITASRDLLVALAGIALVSVGVLVIGVRGVPRQPLPRRPITPERDG